MNIKILSILSLFIVIYSCKKTEENIANDADTKNNTQELTESDISKLDFIDFGLDEKTEGAIENWQEYYQLVDIVKKVKKADLVFFKDNNKAIITLLKDLKKNIPEPVNTPATLARILVLETKIFKLESLSNLSTTRKEELLSTIKEFLVAVSNLNFQMNKKLEKDNQNIQKPQ
ncbi:hypothetical protein L3X37_03235 [Sabulilitoribacter arenilitoris]|uniref:Uncharacterized protein n=1 Tax=Wocania arenilitoris TaxID=2044858 RepID=A0AAE3ENJ4_9FLAO|nr:hypothetical protein [Wocania arenilitoris]MCF7567379.1 hypothetical protein [Wocania arenilitoris]